MPELMYDAHCHLFSKDYLLDEIGEIAKHILDTGKDTKSTDKARENSILTFIHFLYELAGRFFGSPESNMDFLVNGMKRSWDVSAEAIAISPLMMDIFYILHKPDYNDPDKKVTDPGELIDKIHPEDFNYTDDDLNEAKVELKQLLGRVKKVRGPVPDTGGLFYTKGFIDHLRALRYMVETKNTAYVKLVRPFLAIDTRRDGILDYMVNNVDPVNGPFFGVKLYPRLGVHPKSKTLRLVFDFCAKNSVPVTTHTNHNGFPPGFDCVAHPDYSDPALFAGLLDDYEGLGIPVRINFAHFGTDRDDWRDTIIGLMKKHKDVYTDISAYSARADLDKFRKVYDAEEIVRERVMFGTDYDIITVGGTLLEDYFRMFSEVFSEAELNRMRTAVPAQFFGA